jgi:hypothetical protein
MKKEKTAIEKIRAGKENLGIIGGYVALIGAMILLIATFQIIAYGNLADQKYLTNPDQPISQMQNATYTISKRQIDIKMNELIPIAIVGGVIGLLGLMTAFSGAIVISNRELHKMQCIHSDEMIYCPVCGIKLSRLKEKET